MTNLMKPFRWALPLVGVALGLAACTTQQTGNPITTGETSPTNSAPATSAGAANGIANLDACELLTTEDAAQFQAQGPGQEEDTRTSGATSSCGWHGRSSTDRSVSFGVLVRASQGIDELQNQAQASGGTVTAGSLNGRDARQAKLASGGCILALKVGADSRVDMSVVIGGVTDPTESCQIASDIANIVEPKLPPEAN